MTPNNKSINILNIIKKEINRPYKHLIKKEHNKEYINRNIFSRNVIINNKLQTRNI